jgi:hypothetical protein
VAERGLAEAQPRLERRPLALILSEGGGGEKYGQQDEKKSAHTVFTILDRK